jgi:uncharacterized protein (DUF1330 family)
MAVNPTPDQIATLQAIAGSDDDGPLVMLNLNSYRERAAYEGEPPGGGSPDVSGREAYERYGRVALPVLARVGGEILWGAPATMTVIGDEGDGCDEVIAVRYPSVQAFLDLALAPEVQAAFPHRDAALERAALIRCDDLGGSARGSGHEAA